LRRADLVPEGAHGCRLAHDESRGHTTGVSGGV
jgi:hypothetical protein